MLQKLLLELRSGQRKSNVRSTVVPDARFRVEPLDTRVVPACNVGFAALTGVLTINCGAAADTVNISDNGAGGISGDATDAAGAQVPFSFAGVSTVNVATGKGNDTVNYTLTANNTTPTTVNIGLGDGADKATVNANAVGLAINSALTIAVNGGKGNDVESAAVDVVLAGSLNLTLSGGDSNDTIDAEIMLEAGSTGNYTGLVNGSKGDDTLTHAVRGGTAGILNATVDGSPNFDTAFRTANVAKENIEADNIIL
jgi:hypothetical protein